MPPIGKGRTHFVLGRAEFVADPPRFRVRPLPSVSSADIYHGCQANCYVELRDAEESPAGKRCVHLAQLKKVNGRPVPYMPHADRNELLRDRVAWGTIKMLNEVVSRQNRRRRIN